MKLNLKILKAINKGLNEALTDLIDSEDDSLYTSKSHSISLYANQYKKDYQWISDNFVDLKLPSGTLWAKCNLGAHTEEEYGNYYAAGELLPKDEYTLDNYNFKHAYSPIYKLNQIPLDKDVAYNENHLMCMPTKDLFEELCSLKFKHVEVINGVRGIRIYDDNLENSIFLPTTGYFANYIIDLKECGLYWSSTIDTANSEFYHFHFDWRLARADYEGLGYIGRCIRPVAIKL